MPEGTYTLLVLLEGSAEIEVGALGSIEFSAGSYAYTGSAFGPGGFDRIDRHRSLVAGDHDVRHWHVDYLLGHPAAGIDGIVTSPGLDAECDIARGIPGERIPGFGASDCDCDSHLVFAGGTGDVRQAVERVHEMVRQ